MIDNSDLVDHNNVLKADLKGLAASVPTEVWDELVQ
jgi:hypothetical protein